MPELPVRLATYRWQHAATPEELALPDDLGRELARLRTGTTALSGELRAELPRWSPRGTFRPVEVISRIMARLEALL